MPGLLVKPRFCLTMIWVTFYFVWVDVGLQWSSWWSSERPCGRWAMMWTISHHLKEYQVYLKQISTIAPIPSNYSHQLVHVWYDSFTFYRFYYFLHPNRGMICLRLVLDSMDCLVYTFNMEDFLGFVNVSSPSISKYYPWWLRQIIVSFFSRFTTELKKV